jgi:hypothetical protein
MATAGFAPWRLEGSGSEAIFSIVFRRTEAGVSAESRGAQSRWDEAEKSTAYSESDAWR